MTATAIINAFPGYKYVNGKNMYHGVDVSRGGYVYGKPGIWENVALIDSQSHHPTSAIAMNYFGEYTPRFKDILDARLAIKNGRFEEAKAMMNGQLAEFLDDPSVADSLAYALKIAINSVYGLTSASFINPFKDARNVNNIVALRGALFMKELQDVLEAQGKNVVAVRTDSQKIANADPETLKFCFDFAEKYGYSFDFEAVYDRMCLVNKAVYIAKYATPAFCQEKYGRVPKANQKHGGEWTATGAQFQHPYVFKTLFSKEPINFEDLCETKEVSSGGAMYLDKNEGLDEGDHNYIFVGRVGLFTPIKAGEGGAELMVKRDDKYSAVAGTKGYRWLESEQVKYMSMEDAIDMRYFHHLVDDAIDTINKFGDFEHFVGESEYVPMEGK